MRFVTAVYVPQDKKVEADALISKLRAPNTDDFERIHLNGRWQHEELFSVYTFYSWWNPVQRFSAFVTLCADRELKILHFEGVSSSLSFSGFRSLTERSKLQLLAKADLWAGVKHYFTEKQTLYPVQCYVEGEQEEPLEVASILGDIETVRVPHGNLYMFHVTNYRDLIPLVRAGIQCLIWIGTEGFIYNSSGLLPAQQGDINEKIRFIQKYLNLS